MKTQAINLYNKIAEHLFSPPFRSLPNGSRLLVYHSVNKDERPFFEEHLRFLCDHFAVMTAGQLVDLYLSRKITSNDRYCAITFDDGFNSMMEHAIPALQHYGISATIFVNYNLYQLTQNNDVHALRQFCREKFPQLYSRGLDPRGLNLAQLQELIAGGFEIGSHTVSHPDAASLNRDELMFEFQHPIKKFNEELGCSVDLLAYPYGRKKNFNALAKQVAFQSGYKAAFSGISRLLRTSIDDFMEIPRTNVSFNRSFAYFKASLNCAEDFKDLLLGEKKTFLGAGSLV